MNREYALRYFLLKHLWRNRRRVRPEVHRSIARSLRIESSGDDGWTISWNDMSQDRTFNLQYSEIVFYRRGDAADSPPSKSEDFRETADRFVAAAFGESTQNEAPQEVSADRTADMLRSAVWAVAGAVLAVVFSLPPAAAALLGAAMIVEMWLPKGKLVLAVVSLPLSLLLGLPGALLHLELMALQFLDTRPEWRRTRVALHAAGLAIGFVVPWRHREYLSISTTLWALLPVAGSLAIAIAHWLRMSEYRIAPLTVPVIALALGCVGHSDAALFLVGCAVADLAITSLLPSRCIR